MRSKKIKPGKTKSTQNLIRAAKSLLCNPELTEALANMLVKDNGDLGFLLKVLRERPRIFNPFILKNASVYREPATLDRKTAELIAVGASAALMCDHCLEAHMRRAVAEGASLEEVMDALLVAGAISESSTLSVAFRKYKQLEGKLKKGEE